MVFFDLNFPIRIDKKLNIVRICVNRKIRANTGSKKLNSKIILIINTGTPILTETIKKIVDV